MKVVVTGAAGFIGMHVAKSLLENGNTVLGIDDINNYYDVNLKKSRLKNLSNFTSFSFVKCDISEHIHLNQVFKKFNPEIVIHLAAQAGVRYSLINPYVYGKSNLIGFLNILEASRQNEIDHLLYASSSSVYGDSNKLPLREDRCISKPVSLYAATKASNELMAFSYSHLFKLKVTGIRYFTVYGPWGRPDMAPWIFTSKILSNEKIKVFNYGDMLRDFTYIDDATLTTLSLINRGDSSLYEIFNIGNSDPIILKDFISNLELVLNKKAHISFESIQNGDVKSTYADTMKLKTFSLACPSTKISEGLDKWTRWYLNYHEIK
jgi:UDP-glucuronate 4-epimerase